MAEEFEESDVFWPEQSYRKEERLHSSVFQDQNVDPAEMVMSNSTAAQQNSRQLRMKKSKQSSSSQSNSLPVNIPSNRNKNKNESSCNNNSNNSSFLHYSDSSESEDDLEDAEMVVPPHLMVARRFAGQMAFSVCTGNGRTLKGRDLSRFRNSILRMTGFLET